MWCEMTAGPPAGSCRRIWEDPQAAGYAVQNQDGFVPAWSTGMLPVWGELHGCTGIPQGPAQYLALILRAFCWGAEGAVGLNQTARQDGDRRTILRDRFHMIDICSCLFVVSEKHTTGWKSGFIKAGWGRGSMTDAAARMTFGHLLFVSRLQPFPAQWIWDSAGILALWEIWCL